ncbi:Hypothetical protein I595_1512 [Croceitalea dokdonensis DOKDO 023]|uniref:Uncharacterized protein n=1 Tax=Croceitalea dokdonensis DOKDO 023 TaxID=1300341 RepID=A0A0N8H4D7_9FLAO|nr:Hypothetical protein I595_1512 [Croceitalea dokdonensis DOKDO 023]
MGTVIIWFFIWHTTSNAFPKSNKENVHVFGLFLVLGI